MKNMIRGLVATMLLIGPVSAWAHEEHDHGAGHDVTIKGELVDCLCYVAMAA